MAPPRLEGQQRDRCDRHCGAVGLRDLVERWDVAAMAALLGAVERRCQPPAGYGLVFFWRGRSLPATLTGRLGSLRVGCRGGLAILSRLSGFPLTSSMRSWAAWSMAAARRSMAGLVICRSYR